MLNALAVLDSDGLVSYERFLNYYSSVSALVDSDEDFVAMLKGCWGVSDKAPPPVVGRQFAGRGLNPHNIEGEGAEGTRGAAANPVAKQHYGDIIGWNQEESWLEQQQSQRKPRDLGLLQAMHARDSDVIGWTKLGQKTAAGTSAGAGTRPGQGLGQGDHDQFNDFRPTGGKRQELLATFHSSSIKQNLDWTAASKKPKPQAQPEQKAGSSAGGEDEGTRAAGRLTKERHRVRDAGGVRHEGKLNTNTTRHFGGPSPFGVTYEVRPPPPDTSCCLPAKFNANHTPPHTPSFPPSNPRSPPPRCTEQNSAASGLPPRGATEADPRRRPSPCRLTCSKSPFSPSLCWTSTLQPSSSE